MANLTGKTIGQLTFLPQVTNDTLFPVELSGVTYHISYSSISQNDVFVTGATYDNANTLTFTNTTGGTFDVSFNEFTGITANTISATTYENLPLDVFVTGGTYNEGVYQFENNNGNTFDVSATTTYSSGVISGGTWSSVGDGQVNLPNVKVALFNNSDFLEPIYVYSVGNGTTGSGDIPQLEDNDTNYVYIEYNGGFPKWNVSTDNTSINGSDVVLYMIVFRLGNFVHTLEFGEQGAGLPNKINNRIISTDRFARESGFSLGLSGSTGVVTLTAGVSWNGTFRQFLAHVNSQDDVFFQNFHVGGNWVYEVTADTLNNLFYDDGTDPVLATPGKFLVNWYYRGQEINDHLYEVWGNNEYNTLSEAQLSTEPILPELITSHAFLVGRIIVEVASTTGSVESSFVKVFQGSQVQSHNDLTGIQGGGPGEYFHLDFNEYSNLPLLNTNNVFQSGVTANTISATTYENLPLDVFVTGGTFDNNSDTLTFTNNSGGTFNVSGLTDYYVTGGTLSGTTLTLRRNGLPDVLITGFTSSGSTVQLPLPSIFLTFAGGTPTAGLNITFNPFISYLIQGGGGGTTANARQQFIIPLSYSGNGVFTFTTRRATAVTSAVVNVFIDGVLSNINGTTQNINPSTTNVWETFSYTLTTPANPGQTINVVCVITLGNGNQFYFRDKYFNY
jgi:hypothetical protein